MGQLRKVLDPLAMDVEVVNEVKFLELLAKAEMVVIKLACGLSLLISLVKLLKHELGL